MRSPAAVADEARESAWEGSLGGLSGLCGGWGAEKVPEVGARIRGSVGGRLAAIFAEAVRTSATRQLLAAGIGYDLAEALTPHAAVRR